MHRNTAQFWMEYAGMIRYTIITLIEVFALVTLIHTFRLFLKSLTIFCLEPTKVCSLVGQIQ